MAVAAARVNVATSATRLDTAESDSTAGRSVLVRNRGAAAVNLGASGVTTATGYQLDAGETVAIDLDPGEQLHGICASGTVACHVLQRGV